MATPAVWQNAQGRIVVDTAVLVGASVDANGRLVIDTTASGGAATPDANNRPVFNTPVSAQVMPAATSTSTFSFTTQRSFTRVISFVATGSFSMAKQVARMFSFGSTGGFSLQRVVNLNRAFSSTGAFSLSRNLAKFYSFISTGTYSFSRLIQMQRSLVATGTPFIDGVIQRLQTDVGGAIRALLFGRRGPVHYRYRLMKSDIYGNEIEQIKTVKQASISLSNFRDHSWELSLEMIATDRLDPVQDYVKVIVEVRRGLSWQSFPMGLYRLRRPKQTHTEQYTKWELTGESIETLVASDMPATAYTAPAGADILTLVKQILTNHGIPAERIAFPPVTKALTNGIVFDPTKDEQGAYWLQIINTLLNAGGFRALYADQEGKLKTELFGSLTVIHPNVQIGPDYEPIAINEVVDDYEDDRFANRVIVYSGNVNDAVPIVSVRENHNPVSEASIDKLGRIITKNIHLNTVVTQADADTMAQAELERSSGYYRKVTLLTLPDPRRGPHEIYQVELTDAYSQQVISGTWNVTSWTLPLSSPPEKMTHEITQVVPV